jgi:hypothetical protein
VSRPAAPASRRKLVEKAVVLVLLRREEARAAHRLLAHQHRREDGLEARRGRAVERPAVEGQRQQRRVADEVAEARARDPGRPLHVEPAELEVLGPGRRRLADHPLNVSLRVVLLGIRYGLVRRVRNLLQQLVAGRLRGGELIFEGAQLLLDLLQLLDLFGRRLALDLLPPAQLVDLRDELTPARVGLQQPVERLARSLARHRGPEALRFRPRSLEVDHPVWRKATRSFICCEVSCDP